jgi:hypothetical protein
MAAVQIIDPHCKSSDNILKHLVAKRRKQVAVLQQRQATHLQRFALE